MFIWLFEQLVFMYLFFKETIDLQKLSGDKFVFFYIFSNDVIYELVH
jgi:hypothetical protein